MSQSLVTFEDGQTALLRDPRQVPVRLRRPYEHAKLGFSAIAVDAMDIEDEKQQQRAFVLAAAAQPALSDASDDALILALVESWSFGDVTQAVLSDLPGSAYDELLSRCEKLAPQMSTKFVVNPDPKAVAPGDSPAI